MDRLFLYWRNGLGPRSLWAASPEQALEKVLEALRADPDRHLFPYLWGSLRPATVEERDDLYNRMAAQFGG